jgi:hypothetical protein
MKTTFKHALVLVLSSFVFVGCETAHESKTWEYKVLRLANNGDNVQAKLNQAGAEGWVLVSTAPGDSDEVTRYIFKRPQN